MQSTPNRQPARDDRPEEHSEGTRDKSTDTRNKQGWVDDNWEADDGENRYGTSQMNPRDLKRFRSGGYGSGIQDERHLPTTADEWEKQGIQPPSDSAKEN